MLGRLGADMVTTGDSCLCVYVNAKACRIREPPRLSQGYLESVSEIPGLRCPGNQVTKQGSLERLCLLQGDPGLCPAVHLERVLAGLKSQVSFVVGRKPSF